jgi:hypothetical protein
MTKHPRQILPLLLLVALLAACGPSPAPTSVPTRAPTAGPAATTAATAVPTVVPTGAPTPGGGPLPTPAGEEIPTVQFAAYTKEPVEVQPAVSQPAIAPDLSNVNSAFLFSSQQLQRLAQNGFVVSPSGEKEFYVLYEQARYDYEPIFVSSDSLLHIYHLLFDKLLRSLERESFIPALKGLNARMLADSMQQYESLRGTSLEEQARRNVAFFAVGSYLLDPSVQIPTYAQDLADAEIALIEAHDGIHFSPLFPALPYGEDYTQYIPRGHYTRSEDLKAYFKSLMWYGRMTFMLGNKVDNADNREMTQRALLITLALANDAQAIDLWNSIYEPTVFFVGRSDDLLYSEYMPVMEQVYGANPDPSALADEDRLTQFMQAAQSLRPPRILGIVIGPETKDVEAETKGFRFMGQRFIPDSYMFRQLIWRNVSEECPPNRRGLPKGLDVLAVLGSERAYTILDEEGDTRFYSYTVHLDRLRQEFSAMTETDWTQNLYWSWLYTFFPLLEKPGAGYPVFMQNQAWVDKSLNTVLGSWAELRHDTILYAKQAYAEMGGGGKGPPPEPVPPKGYVEPVPEFYARLAALAAMTRQGLEERGLVGSQGDQGPSPLATAVQSLQDLANLSLALKAMAEKELVGQPLSDADYERIRFYGGELETFTFAAADEYSGPGGYPTEEEEPQAAVVADVATDPDPNCDGSPDDAAVLEEGMGRIQAIYVVAPIEGQLVVAKGGVFSYYEFPWPADDRLTDEKWRQMLDDGQAPALPEWTASYRVDETEEYALREAIWKFNYQLVAALWWPEPGYLDGAATGAALQQNQSYAQSLLDQQLYEGDQLVRLDYLSFDLQDATHAVVTTREAWTASRYQMSADTWEEGTLVATRPEYVLGVVYNLEQVDGTWLVSQVQTQGEVPAWQPAAP